MYTWWVSGERVTVQCCVGIVVRDRVDWRFDNARVQAEGLNLNRRLLEAGCPHLNVTIDL